jgi:hypothetical protein
MLTEGLGEDKPNPFSILRGRMIYRIAFRAFTDEDQDVSVAVRADTLSALAGTAARSPANVPPVTPETRSSVAG